VSRTRFLLVLVVLGCLCCGTPVASAEVGWSTGSTSSAPAPSASSLWTSSSWRWPLGGTPVVTRPFDPPPTPYAAGHRGVDLGGTAGQPVLAAGAGVVSFAGLVAGRPVVSVQHADGLRTTYEPVAPQVAAGQVVAGGSPLGVLVAGHAGCPADACLHWGLRRGEAYLDPLSLLRPPRVRLLPWS
jgi:murein DD-endopeptidase MepM/ murein hydrolase activator NlpD